NLCRRIG
ncbi:Long-chain-fatty-acid--CoA ligase FadD15, partial [Haemophilus influenzae]